MGVAESRFHRCFEFLALLSGAVPRTHRSSADASCVLPRVLEAYPGAGSVHRAPGGGLNQR
jgi:hypothetical protein